jgi:hypothetical protein
MRPPAPMRPLETIGALTAFERRGPGTDAERRAARWLAGELIAARHRVRVETFWCRPNWALAHAWHVALALAGSLLSPSHPPAGVVILGIAGAAILMDEVTGISPGRRLTPERASQNVVSAPRRATPTHATDAATTPTTTRLIITANYDAGRTALVYRDAFRRPAAALRRVAGPLALGWLAWLSIAIGWLLAIAIVRTSAHHASIALGVAQLPPTVALVLGLALLLEAGSAGYGPGAGDNASGVALAIELARSTAATTPTNLDVELVLAGAGEGGHRGIRHHLRSHKQDRNTIVLGVGPCGSGHPHHWLSDGRLIPLRYARPLRILASSGGGGRPGASPVRTRGAMPAFPARALGLPAIAIGSLDRNGLARRSHRTSDVAAAIDETALGHAIDYARELLGAIDASLARPDREATRA